MTHSHPKGEKTSNSDFEFAEQVSLKLIKIPFFYIYHVPSKKYYPF